MARRLALLLPLLWLAAAPAAAVQRLDADFESAPLTIVAADSCLRFTVYEADTIPQRSRGLMHVRELPLFHGMLFRFAPDLQPSMWMRNTYIPLDMLFIDAQGEVVHVAADARPHSLTRITTELPTRYVLEINGGLAAALGIRPGARVQHRWLGV